MNNCPVRIPAQHLVLQNGFGRENGIEAMREFMQTKSVWIGMADRFANSLTVKAD